MNNSDILSSQTELVKSFVEYEQLRGYRQTRKIKYYLNRFFDYLSEHDLELVRLKHRDAQTFQTYLSTLTNDKGEIHYAPKTIVDIVGVVSNLYNYLKYMNLIYANPFTGINLLKCPKKLPKNLPDEKGIDKYLEYLRYFWKMPYVRDQKTYYKTHVIGELLYATGLRIDETAKLKVEDVDFDRNIIIVREGKGNKERYCYLTEYAAGVLKIYIEEMRELVNMNPESKHIFGVVNGKNLDSALNRSLNKTGEAVGIGRFTSHYFRHCIGFHLLRRGCDMRYIQIILGHESLKTTERYTKVEKTDLKNELDKYHPRQFKNMKSGRK